MVRGLIFEFFLCPLNWYVYRKWIYFPWGRIGTIFLSEGNTIFVQKKARVEDLEKNIRFQDVQQELDDMETQLKNQFNQGTIAVQHIWQILLFIKADPHFVWIYGYKSCRIR